MTTKPFFFFSYKINVFVIALAASLVVGGFTFAAESLLTWENDFDKASAQAKASNRLLFIHFYGDNCPPCKSMDANVFTNPQVAAVMNRDFVVLKLDVAGQHQLAKRFEVKAIPTDVVLSPDGQLIHRRQGGITAERFSEYLASILNFAQKEVAAKQITVPNQVPGQVPVSITPTMIPSPTTAQVQPQVTLTQQVAAQPTNRQEPLRDPFTKQPVTVPANPATPIAAQTALTPPERLNMTQSDIVQPTVQQAPPAYEVVASPTFSQPPTTPILTAPQAVSTPLPKNSPTSSTSFPVGAPSNSDEIATTMVEVPLGLEGYCPVVLSTEERWIPGNPAYYTMYRGHVFRFSSEEAMGGFIKEPSKYAPVAMGEDIVQMVERNKKIYGNRKFGAWFQGRVFLFCNQESLDAFASRPEYYAEIALKYETAFKGTLGRF